MPLTRDFRELVQKRIANDPAFGNALLREGINIESASEPGRSRRTVKKRRSRKSSRQAGHKV